MSSAGGLSGRARSSEKQRQAASTWERQQLGTLADRHPLLGDYPDQLSPPPSPSVDSHFASSFSGGAPVGSAASAASMTSSPDVISRPARPPIRSGNDVGEWEEDGSEDKYLIEGLEKLKIAEGAPNLSILQQLMRQGSWLAIADKMKETRKREASQPPDEYLVFTTYHVLALMKLRNYAAAQEVLSTLGDLNSQKYRFEQHSEEYPNKAGSMLPFGLRWLHAELPHRLGQTSTTIDRLYDLLNYCNERIDFLQNYSSQVLRADVGESEANPGTPIHDVLSSVTTQEDEGQSSHRGDSKGKPSDGHGTPTEEQAADNLEVVESNFVPAMSLEDDDFGEFVTSPVDSKSDGNVVHATLFYRWRRRQEVVLCSVLSHHLDQKEYVLCLNWLEDLVKKRPHDVVVLSKYGYVQLQLGDLYGARRTFATVEGMCERQGRSTTPASAGLLSCNKGLLYFSLKQYAKAVKEFDAVLQSDPGNVVSANNKALCLMYSRDLVGATQVLESVLQESPKTTLNETLVLNLCSMYELASMNSVESKKTLSSWILRIAPDDFDLTCTRL